MFNSRGNLSFERADFDLSSLNVTNVEDVRINHGTIWRKRKKT